ncbi:MAG: ABC transporter permease [Acidobacteriota bacterium]
MQASWLEATRIAGENLLANKLRTFLTLIGIVVGVMAVIAVVTVIDGLNSKVAQTFTAQGSNVFSVRRLPQVILSRDQFLKYNKRKDLTIEDARYVAEHCRGCLRTGWDATTSRTVKYQNEKSEGVFVRGVSEAIMEIEAINFNAGRPFTDQEIKGADAVCVIGWDVVDNLFPGIDPLGHEIRVANIPFRIVGVTERLGTIFGFSRDNFVMIPITTYHKIFGTRNGVNILVAANQTELIDRAQEEVRLLLRARMHKSYRDNDDGFSIETSQIFLDLYANATKNIYLVSFIISGVSLVVGGIVIMNIMLVSVTERTREIGIRKAMGARRFDVLVQFLVESVTISLAGGMIGILSGYGLAYGISVYTEFPLLISAWSAVLGVSVSSAVGIIFGVYPANRAAQLDPIEALRAE